jgi:membrane-associated HD superfamily phosphohydrolase
MNLVGKIFVVLIFVMALAFMCFAMAVYATHKNWYDVVTLSRSEAAGRPVGLQYQLEDARKENTQRKTEADNLAKELNAEKDARAQAVAKLENELKTAVEERQKREKELAELVNSERQAVAAMRTAQEATAHSEKMRDALESQVTQMQEDRDSHFKEAVRITDELHQVMNDKEQLDKRLATLTADLAKAKEALRYFDINENADYKAKTPPRINAIVLTVTGAGLVEISAGSDQGLQVGHHLEVYRATGAANTYVGRIEVVKTTPDKVVCKIDPKFQNSNMMRGDRVVSKIE